MMDKLSDEEEEKETTEGNKSSNYRKLDRGE